LYFDFVYFPSLTGAEFTRLDLAFNACTRYVYGLRHFDHISECSREILGCTLFEYLELQLAGFFHKIVIFGAPDYLSSRLVSGRSPRHRFLVIPNSVPVTVVFVYEMCCLLPLGPLLVLVLLSWKQSDANLDIATKNCQNFRNFRRNLEELHLNYEAKNCL
jgi:hypothetical protein